MLTDAVLLRIEYAWNRDNTVATRTEYDYTTGTLHTAVVTFTYDRRHRLIGESRVLDGTQTVYNLAYAYDQLGNRTTKTDYTSGRPAVTVYDYDTNHNPDDMQWPTRNNRLLLYQEHDPNGRLQRTVRYTYYQNGHVADITVKDEYLGVGDPNDYLWSHQVNLVYSPNQQLYLALWQSWTPPDPDDPNSLPGWQDTPAQGWEFRYDGSGRQRYLARPWSAAFVEGAGVCWTQEPNAVWTDYLGSLPYGDYNVDPNRTPAVIEQQRYLLGDGIEAEQTLDGDTDPLRYLHGDLISSTMLLTDESGQPVSWGGVGVPPAVPYTAFGEPITPGGVGQPPPAAATRYQYAGGYGYESGLITLYGVNPNLPPITLQHVGERWYQPGHRPLRAAGSDW